jgi:hypothetical protein
MARHLNPAAARERHSIYIRGGLMGKTGIGNEAFQTVAVKKFGGSFPVT